MTLDVIQHKTVMVQILKDIYSNTTLSPFLGFKGGTAVYLLYSLDRFSVDLDFDLLDVSKEDNVFSHVHKILGNYGKIKEAAKKRYNLFFLLSYEEKARNVKVEINRRFFGSTYELKTYLGLSMLVMTQADMFANKLVAMYERMGKTNRDIYDVWFFLKNRWPLNQKIIEQRVNMPLKQFLPLCIQTLEKVDDRTILSGIGELLNAKQKVWVKNSLKTETLFLLKLLLKNEE